MRRIRIILAATAVGLAGLAFAPSAVAGDFADEPCNNAVGDNYICPPATTGASYAIDIKLKEPWEGCTTMVVSSGVLPPGLSMDTEGRVRGAPTTAGSYTFYATVSWSNNPPCIAQSPSDRKFTINVGAGVQRMFVATPSLPDANIGQAYAPPALTAANGTPSSWSVAGGSLPPGIQLASNGTISGTPTASGVFTFTVQANGPNNSDTKQLSIFVLAPLEIQSLTGAKAPELGWTAKRAVNEPLATGVKAAGGRGPYAYSSTGALPPGITLDAATGLIAGTGTTAGRYKATITVTDATGAKASANFAFTVLPLLQFVKGKGLPTGKVDRLYSAKIPVSGKDARSAQFAISGRIPPGLELDDTGRLTGVLLKAGTYRLRVFAFAATGSPVTQLFTIRVRP
jgi:large repetitive protein